MTGIVFVPSTSSATSHPKYLISSSKDTLLKVSPLPSPLPSLLLPHALPWRCDRQVWDMSTQHCIQTIVGHRCEIWSLALAPLPLQDTHGEASLVNQSHLILTGSSDETIRGYLISSTGHEASPNSALELSDEVEVLSYVGCLQSQGGEKCAGNI